MVYRVYIVDDESYIADSTAMRLQNDNDHDMDVSVFYNAKEAFEAIRTMRVDILICDIRMPEMSGLELMDSVLQIWPKCQIILLSAYAQFDYVYHAIQHVSVDYVLKQDGYTAIAAAFNRALERININAKREDQLRTAHQQAQSALPWLEREFLLDLVHGAHYETDTLERTKSQLSLSVDIETPAYMIMPVVHGTFERETLIERTERANSLAMIARDFLPEKACMISVQIDEKRMLWLWQFSDNEPRTAAQLESAMEGIQLAAQSQMELNLSFAYCINSRSLEAYPTMYRQLNTMVERHVSDDVQQWIYCADLHDDAGNARLQVLNTQVQHWNRIYKASAPEADTELDTLLCELASYTSLDDVGYMRLYLQIAMQLAQTAQDVTIDREQKDGLDFNVLYNARAHASSKDAAIYLKSVSDYLTQKRREDVDHSTRALIVHVQEYIHAHLNEDISLVKLAQYVHMNTSYLSRVFKLKTGRNLKDYIWELRLNRAYELLRRPDLRVHEVGEQLGFLTPSYFSYFFKKHTGMTPREFRDSAK